MLHEVIWSKSAINTVFEYHYNWPDPVDKIDMWLHLQCFLENWNAIYIYFTFALCPSKKWKLNNLQCFQSQFNEEDLKSPQKWYDNHPQNMLTCRLKLSFFVRYLLSYPKYDDLKQSLLWMGLILLLTGVTQPAKVIFIGFPIMDHVNHPFSGTPMAQTGRFSCVEPREGPKSSHSAESEPQGVANSTSANDTKKGLIAMVQQWLHKIT